MNGISSPVGAVAVDFGGTLTVRERVGVDGRLVEQVLRACCVCDPPRGFGRVFDLVYADALAAGRRGVQVPFVWVFGVAAELAGLMLAEPVGVVAERVAAGLPDTAVDARAAEAVRLLRGRVGRLVLAANTPRPATVRRATLERAGIGDCFDVVLLSSEMGACKPHPLFYRRVIEAAGCAPGRVLFVGDRVDTDVQGPRRAGMQAVLVDPTGRGDDLPGGVALIGHIAQLPRLLDRCSDRQAALPTHREHHDSTAGGADG